MTEKSSQSKPILGYSDKKTVMLDFDDTQFKAVKYWALRTSKWFKLGGFLILKSSRGCYHVVFDRTVSWIENMHIVAWVCLQSHKKGLLRWFLMQCIKEWSTLRVTPKKDKPSPRIVFRYGRQNGQIKSFMEYRRTVKNIIAKLA